MSLTSLASWFSTHSDATLRALTMAVLSMLPAAQLPAQDTAAATIDSTGTLRPGDAIRLRIWREPDLSGEFPVDETGVVVLPKLGPLRVTTGEPDSLREQLVHAYAVYLVNPSIQVQVLRRIQVLGAVKSPGLYPVDPTMSVADAIALAGGITPQGRSDKVEVRRQGQQLPGRLSGRVLIGDSPIRSGDQLFVPERSWISRNPGLIIGALGLTSTIIWQFVH